MSRRHRRAAKRNRLRNVTEYRSALPVAALTAYSGTALADATQATDDAPQDLPRFWEGIIGMEGVLTGDGRLIENEALEWATPVPFRYVKEDTGGHQGAVVAGRILSIQRDEGGQIRAWGDFDHGSEEGRESARLVGEELMNGVSMDLDSVAFEVRVAAEVIEAQEAFWDQLMAEEDGEEIEEPERETDEEGRVVVAKINTDDEVMATTSARIRAATLVSVPAFAEATIKAIDALPAEVEAELALVASGAPVDPPAAWFTMPEPDAPTALTITDDGHVYGHLATWDVCHIADPAGTGVCVMAPKSASNYAQFHTGVVKTQEGGLVTTGVLRFNTQHASLRASASDAAAHYDHTGLAGADIHAIDGKHGIWVSGALRPGLSAEQVRTLRASPLSGDWRYIDGRLDLVGVLAVNLPGFPIPRTQGLVASGELEVIVAAGMIAPEAARETTVTLSRSDHAYLERLINRERTIERNKLRARVDAVVNRRKVETMARKRSMASLTSTTQRF